MSRIDRRTIKQLAGGADTGLPDWADDLSLEEVRFVTEYLVDFNSRAAAVRAKLSDAGPDACASKAKVILKREAVGIALAKASAQDANERMKQRLRIIQELTHLAFYDVTDHVQLRKDTVVFTDTADLTAEQMKAVKGYKQTTGKSESIEVTFHDKVKALELLAKMNGDLQQGGGITINNQNGNSENKVLVLTPEEVRLGLMRKPGERPPPRDTPLVVESPVADDD